MERIRRFFRKLGKGLKNKGYTLVEVAAVVAVTATLAAVVVPIAVDKTKEGKLAAAKQDCQQIGNAITSFYKDVGEFPAFPATVSTFRADRTYYEVLRSGNDTSHDPGSVTISQNWGATHVDYLENHLVVDNPGDPLGNKNNAYLNRHKLNWKGPYVESLTKRDPWGNNYLVYVKAMHTASSGVTGEKEYGWIISAGPNGILETPKTSNNLQGDDIGMTLFSAELGH